MALQKLLSVESFPWSNQSFLLVFSDLNINTFSCFRSSFRDIVTLGKYGNGSDIIGLFAFCFLALLQFKLSNIYLKVWNFWQIILNTTILSCLVKCLSFLIFFFIFHYLETIISNSSDSFKIIVATFAFRNYSKWLILDM